MINNPHGTFDLTIVVTITGTRGIKVSKDLIEYLVQRDLGYTSELNEAYNVGQITVSKLEEIDYERLSF